MQLEMNSYPKYRNRIKTIKDKVIHQAHELCIERALLFTKSYESSKGEHPVIRFAKAMDYLLTNMTIKIWDNEIIVGNRCTKYIGSPLYPEVRVDTIEQDLELYSTRDVQKFLISENDKRLLRDYVIPYWKNEDDTVRKRFYSKLSPDLKELILNLLYVVDTNITNGVGHFIPGHVNVLNYGIDGIIEKVKNRKRELSGKQNGQEFLDSVIIVLNAAKNFIKRFSNLSKELAERENNIERKNELEDISKICLKVSTNPPETFREALQLIYFTHLIAGLEDGGFAISLGRLDQILYPYYIHDIEKGIISNAEIQFLIENFYLKLSTLWNYVLHKGIIAAEGPPIAINLTIGGIDKLGNDASNELSYLLLDSYEFLKIIQPAFSVRIHSRTPNKLLRKTGEAIKFGTSIALFNDLVMIPGLNNLGYTLEDARDYAPIGCVEPAHQCKTFGCTNATQLNIVKCLELTLNNGIDMFTRNYYGLANSKQISTYEDLWDEFVKQLDFFIEKMILTMRYLEEAITELNPQPFLSATIDDCIKRALDITNGGAIYDFTTTQLIGLATVADSLATIKKVVFEEKLLSLEELIIILKKNYRGTHKGKSGEEWRQLFLNRVPKFGNDDDYVDTIAFEVAKLFCEHLRKFTNYRGGKYNPGIYSTSFHLAFGTFTAASADGRKSREALANGVGPTNGLDKNGPTAILNSIMKLENELMTNGNSTILSIHPASFKEDVFVSLIRSFFRENGGYHIQFNVVGKEMLCDAQKHPENYIGLVVRIAGYSVLFNELSKSAQDDIIARNQY
ncbi:MAG: glycyl radical protein [Candidatus Thorarchaeota archaeon]